MTREEKVKVYLEDLRKAKDLIEKISTELKENEDEKIREGLIRHLEELRDWKVDTISPIKVSSHYDAWIAWLEKQKEQKQSITIDQLKSMMLQYLQEAANEKDDSAIEADTDKWARKILGYDFEQKPTEDWREKRKEECPFRRNLDNNLYGCERYADVVCACDGNCSWVVDYPKLKEIQDKQEQKPAEWSEDDNIKIAALSEIIFDYAFHKDALDENQDLTGEYAELYNWLESLPDRLNLQPQAKREQKEQTTLEYLPKEKVYHIMHELCMLSLSDIIPIESEEYKKIDEIISNVRDLLNYPIEQKPAEWSEEEQTIIEGACYALEIHGHSKLADKLKSLHP